MMNELPASLLDYIKSQLAAGVTLQAIREQLLTYDWPADQVDLAVEQFRPAPSPPQSASPGESVSPIAVAAPTVGPQVATPAQTHVVSTFWQPKKPLDICLHWIFRLGFASLFLVNSATAWLHPASFVELLHAFPLTHFIGHTDLFLLFIGVNDLVLGLLILIGVGKKFIWPWAGLWFAAVTIVKFFSL